MARKPQPGGDRNSWGTILNELLDVSHNPDGTIKPEAVSAPVATEVQSALAVQLPPAVADEVAAQPTVVNAAAAAIDAEPRVAANTADIARLELSERTINLRVAGLVMNGTTDETAALQTIINNAATGTTLILDEKANILISGQIAYSGKRIDFLGYTGAKITASSKLIVPLISITNAPRVRFENIEIVGAETAFDGVLDTQAYALHIQGSAHARVTRVRVSGTSRGLMLYSCPNAMVDDYSFIGTATTHATNINFYSGIVVRTSHDVRLSRIWAEKCGHAILVGWTSNRGSIVQVGGFNCFDNGVYISSGNGWDVMDPQFSADAAYVGTIGTGVKMRGSQNVLFGGYVENMGFAAIISGGGIDEGDGFAGRGSKIIGTRGVNCKTGGFLIDDYGGFQTRGATIAYTTIQGGGGGDGVVPAVAGIRVRGTGHKIEGNLIDGWLYDACIRIDGTSTAIVSDVSIRDNTLRKTAVYGIYSLYGSNITMLDNTVDAITHAYAIRTASTETVDIRGTRKVGTAGTTATIRIDATAPVSGVRVINNPRATVSDATNAALLSGNDGSVTANIGVSGAWAGNTAGKALTTTLAQLGIIRDLTTA